MKKTKKTERIIYSHKVKNLMIDLDGTLLGASNVIVSIRFVRKTFWLLRKFGGFKIAFRIMFGIAKVLSTPIPGTLDIKRLTNGDRLKQVVSEKLHLPIEEAENFLKDMVGNVFPSLQPLFYPMPGAKNFLAWAHKRYPMVLATNPVWNQEIIEMRMKWADIDPTLFRSITHAYRMTACKPELQYYKEVLEQENFLAADTMLIGNDLKMDLPAVNAGIAVFIVTKKKGIRPLPVPKGAAPAWTGDFKALMELLS